MKAEELRIGNKSLRKGYLYEDNSFHEITVTPSDIQACLINPDHFRPIELTKEWLIKFGFKLLNFDSYEFDGYKILVLECGKLLLAADSSNNYKAIEHKYLPIVLYVHQLQNLYFALTGEELAA